MLAKKDQENKRQAAHAPVRPRERHYIEMLTNVLEVAARELLKYFRQLYD
jgi:hypothetical protein